MQAEVLINIARSAIKDELFSSDSLDTHELQNQNEYLSERRATFVTLYKNSKLRGCMGSLRAQRKLLDDIIHNAKAAAFYDFRFQPLDKNDLENIEIEISVLSEAKEVIYSSLEELKEKIKINVHGVILEKDQNRATFLPQVWEQLTSFEEFFCALSKKAGLAQDCLKTFPKISVYEVSKFK